jgi:hypothetical protein
VIPLNTTSMADNARKNVFALEANYKQVDLPFVLSTGDFVGPGESAHMSVSTAVRSVSFGQLNFAA